MKSFTTRSENQGESASESIEFVGGGLGGDVQLLNGLLHSVRAWFDPQAM